MATELSVNGQTVSCAGPTDQALLHVLREQFGLTGSKIGCGEGECGSCTVLIDGAATRSCITHVCDVVGKQVMTIEGLADGDELHPLQQAFIDEDAMQCGYCTPGMIMSGVGLLTQNADPSEEEIVAGMQGNICRCGTYPRIVCAIQRAAAQMRGAAGGRR